MFQIDDFILQNKWLELFPSIVSRAKTIQVLAMGVGGNASGSLHLVCIHTHIYIYISYFDRLQAVEIITSHSSESGVASRLRALYKNHRPPKIHPARQKKNVRKARDILKPHTSKIK